MKLEIILESGKINIDKDGWMAKTYIEKEDTIHIVTAETPIEAVRKLLVKIKAIEEII